MQPIIYQETPILSQEYTGSRSPQTQQSQEVNQSLLQEIIDVKAKRNELYSMITKCFKTYLPEDLNALLLAVSLSYEVNKIIQNAHNYIVNLFTLFGHMDAQRVVQDTTSLYILPDSVIERYEVALASVDNQDLVAILRAPLKDKNLQGIINLFKHIGTSHAPYEYKSAGKEYVFEVFDMKYRITSATLNFDNLSYTFDYKPDAFLKTLNYIVQSGEVNPEDQIQITHYLNNHIEEEDAEQQHDSMKQTARQFIQRTVARQNIRVDVEGDILVVALIMKCSGRDFTDNVAIVSPQQLACCFVDNTDMLLPYEITPFFLNKRLYYQARFNIPDKYQVLSKYDGVYDSFQKEMVRALRNYVKYYRSTVHRLLVFPNYNLDNIFVQQITESDTARYDFIFIGIPTNMLPIRPEKLFIYANLRLEYAFQYLMVDVCSHILVINEPINKYIDHITNMAHKLSEDKLVMRIYRGLMKKADYLKMLLYRVQQAHHFLYTCVVKNNIMTEAILGIFTILKSGFLRLDHASFQKFITYELNYYEFIHYDRQTTFYTLLGHIQSYYQKPENDSQVLLTYRNIAARDYVMQQMPIIGAFMEKRSLSLEVIDDYRPASSSSIVEDITEENAKDCLTALVHELQHIPRHGYASTIDVAIPFLPQVLADSTSISPLCSSIRFYYKDQQGIDAGGMWRQTLSIMFNDLLGECKITNGILEQIRTSGKFGKRELDFEAMNKDNPNSPSLLKAVNLNSHTVLVPHYNGYVCRTSSSVFPRLTDKRSCLYYFGRIVAFCLIYCGKMPNFLHENFWKSLVGGRLFFDQETEQKYQEQMQQDQMFKINGTKPLHDLYYELTQEQIELYYEEYVRIWKVAQTDPVDAEFLGIPRPIIEEVRQSGLNLENPNYLRRYATKALSDMRSGQAFGKAYSEFRNGFRHPFATSMASPISQKDLLDFARLIDKSLEVISHRDLESLLTFDPQFEEYMNRQTIIENLFRRNISRLKLESDDKIMVELLERTVILLMDKGKFTHKEILDLVFACTGSRTLTGTEITVNFQKPHDEDVVDNKPVKRYIQFHTCFNQMDVPLLYMSSLTTEQLVAYIKECIVYALQNGYALA